MEGNILTFLFLSTKWLFVNYDCSAYFVRDPELLIKTFGILLIIHDKNQGQRK
jgi:aromatic-L-amino-acid decarboxylase